MFPDICTRWHFHALGLVERDICLLFDKKLAGASR
jgi:hypothetical protein